MANPVPFGVNAYGVKSTPLDPTLGPTTMYYHGGTIVVNGNIIGRINSWHPSNAYNRQASYVYEIHKDTWGLPVDIVPGRSEGFTATFVRSEVWTFELEKALGFADVFNNLTDQSSPFESRELLFRGDNPYRTWSYLGCWLTEKNQNEWSAEGDGVFKVSCAMAYVSRKRIQG